MAAADSAGKYETANEFVLERHGPLLSHCGVVVGARLNALLRMLLDGNAHRLVHRQEGIELPQSDGLRRVLHIDSSDGEGGTLLALDGHGWHHVVRTFVMCFREYLTAEELG